jgi:AraC-like DNA-binding protein
MKPILRKVDTGYNYSFSVREDILPFLYNHWHIHPEIELTLIRKGAGIRLVGDSMEKFEDGDLVLLGSNLPHFWRSDAIYFQGEPGIHVEAIAIHFKEDFWGGPFLQLPEMKSVRALLDLAHRGLKITGHTKELVSEKMEMMLKAREIQRIELLLHMLHMVATSREFSLLSSQGFTTSYDHTNTDRINLIYTYTFNNYHNPIHIKDVAAAANLSPHSFCRYFKTRTLKTYWQFLLEVRIGNACKLLIENKMSVAQICYECGFNNLSNFNRHFKAMLNKTPLQYMKAYVAEGLVKTA